VLGSYGMEKITLLHTLREYLNNTSIHKTLEELKSLTTVQELRILTAAGAPGDLYFAAIARQQELKVSK